MKFNSRFGLTVYQFTTHNLSCSLLNIAHPLYPFKLVLLFKFFCNTFRLFHLLNQKVIHFICLTVNICKIRPKCAFSYHQHKYTSFVVFKVVFVHHTPFADDDICLFGWQDDVWNEKAIDLAIGDFCFLFHFTHLLLNSQQKYRM